MKPMDRAPAHVPPFAVTSSRALDMQTTSTLRFLLAALVLSTIFVLRPSDAQANFFEAWIQGHGALVSGSGHFSSSNDGPRAGVGFQAGARVLFFEAFMDVNRLGNDAIGPDQKARTYFNQIGAGLRFGLPMPIPRLSLALRANGSYAYAPYVYNGHFVSNGGVNLSAGAAAEVKLMPFMSIALNLNTGYGLFGSASARDCSGDCGPFSNSGVNFIGQLGLRFSLGL